MAVVDLTSFSNSSTAITKGTEHSGDKTLVLTGNAAVTNGNSIASIYRILEVPAGYVPVKIWINHSAITSANDVDLGLYQSAEDGGAVISVDLLVDGADMSSAAAIGSDVDGMTNLAITDIGSNFATLASDKISEFQTYVLGFYLNAAATADGTIHIRVELVRG